MIKINFREWFLTITTPIQKWMQKIHRPEYLVKGMFYWKLKNVVRNGDVLLSRERFHLTNYFIPGFWKHAAIVSHDHVIEAVAPRVRGVLLPEWILTKDYVLLLRPRISDAGMAGIMAEQEIGKKYDYKFQPGRKAWWCSELVLKKLQKADPKFKMPVSKQLGIPTVVPSDFEQAVDHGVFDVIMDSRTFNVKDPYE